MHSMVRVGVVGRQVESSTLAALVAEVVAGRGGFAWLQGEPGIGKSTLVDLMAQEAQAAGCTLCRGAGEELMQAFPLRLLAECLDVTSSSPDDARAEIARLLRGEIGGSATLDPVLAATERLLGLVDRICASGPVLLVVEDLQWADEPSLLVWNRLARTVDQIPLLLVGTCRPVPHRTTVERLGVMARERANAYLELGPLATPDVVDIAGRLAGGRPGPRLSAELVRAGGNPLYVRELVEATVRDGLLEVVDDVAELRAGATATPASLTAAIGRRLGFLTDDTASALRMAALLGHEFNVDHWADVTGRQARELAETTEEAAAAGVITEAGQRLAFRHEVIRQVLVDQVPAPLRADLHRDMAQTLVQRGAGMDVVAGHLMAAPDLEDAWVAQWLAGSAESLLYAAPEVSAELLTRAVRPLHHDDPHWEVLASRLARVLFWLGRDDQASEVAGEVLRHTTDVELSAALRILTLRSTLRAGGGVEEAYAGLQPSLEDARLPLRWRARLGAWSAMALGLMGRFEQARARAQEALDDAGRSGDALAIGYARHTLTFISGTSEQIAHIDAALAVLGGDPESMELRILLLTNRIHRLVATGRRDEVDGTLTEGLVLAERIGTIRSAGVLCQAAIACYYYGSWDDALLHVDSVSPEYFENPRLVFIQARVALLALHRGDRELGESRLRAGDLLTEADPPESATADGFRADALATWREMNGDHAGALAMRARWLDMPPGPVKDSRCDEAPYLVRAALAAGDQGIAEAEIGAAWDIGRAEARLRRYGIRRGSRTLHRRATTGWEALTPTERRVAELVAQGLSNPDIAAELFLSRNTVQTHVSHILAKLELRSRIELIRSFAGRAHAGRG